MTVLSAKSTRSVLLIAPLLIFIALFFLWPLGVMMKQAISDTAVLPGRLALVAQSGGVCTAMLDFARPHGIGFSSVLSLGGVLDVDFGELLDALLEAGGCRPGLLEELGLPAVEQGRAAEAEIGGDGFGAVPVEHHLDGLGFEFVTVRAALLARCFPGHQTLLCSSV